MDKPDPDDNKHDDNNLFHFELPEVTAQDAGFIAPPDYEWGSEAIEAEPVTATKEKPVNQFKELPRESEQYRGSLSKSGEQFDPAIHAYPPSETKLGKWRKKTKRQKEQEGFVSPTNALFKRAGESHARIYGDLHRIPFGEGGKIKDERELNGLAKALERYYHATGLKELNPGTEVIFQAVAYSFGVFQREENHEKTGHYLLTIKEFGKRVWCALTRKKYTRNVHDIKTGKVVDNNEQEKETDNAFAGDSLTGLYPEDDSTKH